MLNKIERYIFYLFLFSIPFQVRKVLWYEGWRFNEWQSVSVYVTDVLLISLFIFWIAGYLRQGRKFSISNFQFPINFHFSIFKNPDFYLILFLFISAISIKNSDDYVISWFRWLKLVEFTLFYWYLSNYAFKKFGLYNSALVILISGVFQALIAILQFMKQSSLGLKYLGESVINSDLAGIASFYAATGEKVIRAYGTAPHSNVLASYLLAILFITYCLLCSKRIFPTACHLLFTAYSITLFAFFATFSRVIILAWGVSFLTGTMIYHSAYPRLVRNIFLITLVVASIFTFLYWPEIMTRLVFDGEDQSVQLRSFYNQEALSGGINWFGVGMGNFVNWLVNRNLYLPAYAYQPVHNIYLLLYSETGLFGMLTFLLFLIFLIKKSFSSRTTYYLLLTTSFLFIGFFDHFFLTLQQGSLIFWLSFGVLTFCSRSDTIKEQLDLQEG